MKLRSLYTLSIAGLLLVIMVQVGGMMHAYDNTKKEAERALNECFRQAFIETVDNQINTLPLPEWSIPFYSYIPQDSIKSIDDVTFLSYQQAAGFLQDVYHVTIPLDEMARLVEKKLKWRNIDRTVDIRPAKDRTNRSAYARFKSVLSEKAWINQEKGEAIEAWMFSLFMPLVKDVLFLFLPTLLLVAFLVYSWARQMDSIIKQQDSIEKQRSAFYVLAEKMRLPIGEVRKQISEREWAEIEVSGKGLLDMTERTLAGAKKSERQRQFRKQRSFKVFSIVGMVASCLLLVVWFVYLYRASFEEATYQVDDCFEAAFYDEVMKHRLPLLNEQNPEIEGDERAKRIETPFAKQQREFLKNAQTKYNTNSFIVVRKYNPVDLNYRLRSALIVQRAINDSEADIPLSMHYLDSAFAARLAALGMPYKSGIRQYRPSSDSTVATTGYTSARYPDISSRFIPLTEDSVLCVQGVVKNPYRYVLRSVWYLFLPLWLMFLVMLDCILGQVKVLRMQRHLEQFQKDFTYAMIHDMKSPLSSVLMGAHIMNTGKLSDKPDKEAKYRQAMEEECEHLLTLSNRVLVLTKLDEGHLELNKEEVPLRPLLHDLTAKTSLKASKQVVFHTVYHRCESVYADAFCLREVLGNLIDNAIKYSREEVKIDIICESEQGFCKIKVCDNGLGIPLKDQMLIFNRFERSAAASRSGKGGATGFGLGLNYVQQVMLAHGGKVVVESEEGRFSEFTLYFPMKDAVSATP